MRNYFFKLRQEYIRECLEVYGYINRAHLVRKFDISPALAAIDFRMFNDANHGVMIYDANLKAYLCRDFPEKLIRLIAENTKEEL